MSTSQNESAIAGEGSTSVGEQQLQQQHQQQSQPRLSVSVSVPDNLHTSGAAGAEAAAGPGPAAAGGNNLLTPAGHSRARSASDVARTSRMLSPSVTAALASAEAADTACGVDRLAGVNASVAWMTSSSPYQVFAEKRRGVSGGGGGSGGAEATAGGGNGVGDANDKVETMDKRVRKYYKRQDQLIDAYGKIYADIVQEQPADAEDAEVSGGVDSATAYSIRLAQLSFFVNVALLIIKVAAVALSFSLSVISSLIDSLIDLTSSIVVWVANRQIKSVNAYHYPQGKTRLEPIAIVILAVIMSTSTVQIIIKAIESIINLASEEKTVAANGSSCACPDESGGNGTVIVTGQASTGGINAKDIYVFILVAVVIVLKLILFILCKRYGTTSSTEALALDHRNDCVSNSTVLLMTILSAYVWPFFDAIGAIVMSLYIVYTWVQALRQQIRLLTGYTADPDCLKQITFVCVNHHPLVHQLETVRAFHIGNNYLVEVDIVVPGDTPLREAHDIGESLQRKLERFDWVERAFVHLDYEALHHPSTEHKQV